MDIGILFHEIWLHLKILVQVFGILLVNDENTITSAPATALRLNSEWGQPWGSQFWIVSVTCRLYLPVNYTPQEKFQGFYIQLSMDNHATHISEVFYPFDSRSEVSKKGGHKEFIISTMTNIWEYGGWKDYEIHVGFTNNELTLTDRWPRGTCSGPYTLTGS